MAKIERETQKTFAGNAGTDGIAVFGSMKTGTPIYTDNIEDLQSVAYEQGWEAAMAANEAPFLEEMNGVQYGFSRQLAYLFQEGVAEYDSGTVYYTGSWCKGIDTDGTHSIYESLVDDNLGNPLTDTASWKKVKFSGDSPTSGFTPPLFTPFWFGHKPNDASFVQANYSWLNSGYESAYNLLVEQYNDGTAATETIGTVTVSFKRGTNGMKIVTPDEVENIDAVYLATGIAWYYVLDTENEQFKLPRSSKFMQCTIDGAAVGDYNPAGLPNIQGEAESYQWGNVQTGGNASVTSGAFTIQSGSLGGTSDQSGSAVHLGFNASLSNPIYGASNTVQPASTNMLLYFWLGESQIEETSITGEVLESLNNKAELDLSNCTKPYVVETYVNGSSWYRIWSDGWCEQGGELTYEAEYNWTKTITLLKSYSGDYCVTATLYDATGNATTSAGTVELLSKNPESFTLINWGYANTHKNIGFNWRACGYID